MSYCCEYMLKNSVIFHHCYLMISQVETYLHVRSFSTHTAIFLFHLVFFFLSSPMSTLRLVFGLSALDDRFPASQESLIRLQGFLFAPNSNITRTFVPLFN